MEFIRDNRLRLLLHNFEPPPWPVHLVYDKQNRLPLQLNAFVDFAVLRERLAAAALKGPVLILS